MTVGDYTANKLPGHDVTFLVGTGGVTGGQIVVTTANPGECVVAAGTAGERVLGIATRDGVAGDRVTVTDGGYQTPIANGAITSGTYVKSATTGRVVAFVFGTDNPLDCYGIAVATGSTGNPVLVKRIRG